MRLIFNAGIAIRSPSVFLVEHCWRFNYQKWYNNHQSIFTCRLQNLSIDLYLFFFLNPSLCNRSLEAIMIRGAKNRFSFLSHAVSILLTVNCWNNHFNHYFLVFIFSVGWKFQFEKFSRGMYSFSSFIFCVVTSAEKLVKLKVWVECKWVFEITFEWNIFCTTMKRLLINSQQNYTIPVHNEIWTRQPRPRTIERKKILCIKWRIHVYFSYELWAIYYIYSLVIWISCE